MAIRARGEGRGAGRVARRRPTSKQTNNRETNKQTEKSRTWTPKPNAPRSKISHLTPPRSDNDRNSTFNFDVAFLLSDDTFCENTFFLDLTSGLVEGLFWDPLQNPVGYQMAHRVVLRSISSDGEALAPLELL